MGKKRIIIVVVIIALSLLVSIIGAKYSSNNQWANYGNETPANTNNSDISVDEKKEITIYDIEDGYMTVKFNPDATLNNYTWDDHLKNNNGIYTYEDDNYTSKLGIDVSSHQGNINWKKVKEAGIEFAILRLGYRGYGDSGKIMLDTTFEDNYKKAKAEGIQIGVYFFSQAITIDEVKEEADFVMNNIKDKELDYPVVFDLERIKDDDARTDNLTADQITEMMLEFCKIMEQNGHKSCIYGNAKTFTTKLKLELFNDYQKWYADYQEKPLYPYEYSIWQYTETGKINGITGNVDIDIQFIKK